MAIKNQVNKKGIKKAILFFEDPETKETRTVYFGDFEDLVELFNNCVTLTQKRFVETWLKTKDTKDTKQLFEILKKTKPKGWNTHKAELMEDTKGYTFEISYGIHKKE